MANSLLKAHGGSTIDVDEFGNVPAPVGYVLAGKTFNDDGEDTTTKIGTMKDYGTVNITINSGQSYTIPEGKHSGSGQVREATKQEQTAVSNAQDKQWVLNGRTFWANGELYTGTALNSDILSFAASVSSNVVKILLHFKPNSIFSHIRITRYTTKGSTSSEATSDLYNRTPSFSATDVAYDGAIVSKGTVDNSGYCWMELGTIATTASNTYRNFVYYSAFPYLKDSSGNIYFYSTTGLNHPVASTYGACGYSCSQSSSCSQSDGCGEGCTNCLTTACSY